MLKKYLYKYISSTLSLQHLPLTLDQLIFDNGNTFNKVYGLIIQLSVQLREFRLTHSKTIYGRSK